MLKSVHYMYSEVQLCQSRLSHFNVLVCLTCLHADAFSMTKLHRDIAMRLLECVQDEEFTDQATVKVSVDTAPRSL